MRTSGRIAAVLALCVFLGAGSVSYAVVTWYGSVDQDWYNPDNYSTPSGSDTTPPDSGTLVNLRLAHDNPPTRRNCVIDGGTAVSSSILMRADVAGRTAKWTLTNGATLNMSGYLLVGTEAADAGAEVYINGGSVVNMTELLFGRSDGGHQGLSLLDISGEGTLVAASQTVRIGNASNPAPARVVVRDGAVLRGDGAGGSFSLNIAGTDDAILDVAGGEVQINLDRTWQVPGWIDNGWLVAYGGDGVVDFYYDANTGYTHITGVISPEIPSDAAIVTGFWDDFEGTHDPDFYWCDDPLNICEPPIGNQWTTSGASALHKIDCDSFPPGKVLSLQRTSTSGPVLSTARPRPFFWLSQGFVYRFEHDLYMPSADGECWFIFDILGSTSEIFSYRVIEGRGWHYRRDGAMLNSGVPFPVDEWMRVRVDMHYDEETYSIWYTPYSDGIERNVVMNIPFVKPTSPRDVRARLSFGLPSGMDTAQVYMDDFEIQLIDKTPQGYPLIAPAANPITIDGVVDAAEWANATKVAAKPDGEKGNFNPVMAYTYVQGGLLDDTVVDAHVTYDTENFYVAVTGNNMTSGEHGDTNRGRLEVVFSWDDVSPPVSRIFTISAIDTTSDPNARSVYERIDYTTSPASYSAFESAGGQMDYTLAGDVIQAEMKIPFAYLPEFAGVQPGSTVNVHFNYVENNVGGDHRGSTDVIGEFVPGSTRTAPLMSGVTFPMAGDFNADGCVDIDDLLILAAEWLTEDSAYDLSGSNILDFVDFSMMASNWYLCDE